jgi:hypothetical protein
MFSPSSKHTSGSKSFLWTLPECPIRIHINFQFIERLRTELLEVTPADREVGGLLIGNELSPNGDIEISDYFRLPPSSEVTKNFVVCSDSLTRAIQSWSASHRRVIGFYRTHLEQRIDLRAEDLECIRSKFNDPTNVFLVIRPHDGRASAGLFFWHDGSIVGGLAFPFAATELRRPSWATLVGGSPKESRLNSLLVAARDRAQRVSTRTRIGLFVLLAIFIALAGALRIYHAPPPDISHSLGLRVDRGLLGVFIAWDPATPDFVTARDANLLIWDGSSRPAFVRLTPAQLRAGRTFFTSVSNRVEVRMDVIGMAGSARTESIVSVSRTPDFGSSKFPATGTIGLAPRQEASPPPAANTSEDSSTKQPRKEARDRATVSTPATSGKERERLAELQTPREAPNGPGAVRNPEMQQPAPDPQPEQPASLVAEEPALRSFSVAVPIRARRPEIPSQFTSLIQSDNVVEVQVRIDASGKVTAAKPANLKGPVADLLSKSAVKAALGWQFRPATQNGAAVPSEKLLEFLFRSSSR